MTSQQTPVSSSVSSEKNKEVWDKYSYSLDLAKHVSVPFQASLALLQAVDSTAPFSGASSILDIGSGPGTAFDSLFQSSLPLSPTAPLVAVDISEPMIAQIKNRQSQDSAHKNWSRVTGHVADATDLGAVVPSHSQSHVLSTMGIFLMPDPDAALREVRRVLAPGGVFGMNAMAKAPWAQDVIGQLTVLHPDRKIPFTADKWRTPEAFEAELTRNGFEHVKVSEAALEHRFTDPQDVCNLVWQNPYLLVESRGLSEDEIAALKIHMTQYIKENYPDGVIRGLALVGVAR